MKFYTKRHNHTCGIDLLQTVSYENKNAYCHCKWTPQGSDICVSIGVLPIVSVSEFLRYFSKLKIHTIRLAN